MPNRILALDIHGQRLVAVIVESSFRSYELVGSFEEPRDGDRPLAEQLKAMIEAHGLVADTVVSVLPGRAVAFRFLELPFRDRRRLQQIVPFELEGHLPLPLEEGVVDFQVLGRAGEGARVFAAFVPRIEVAEHLDLLRDAGLDPAVVDFGPLTSLNVLHLFEGDRPDDYAFLHVDEGRATLGIYGGGALQGLRVIDTGDTGESQALTREVRWGLRCLANGRAESLPLLLGGNGPDDLVESLRKNLSLEVQRLEDLPLRHVPNEIRTRQGSYAPALGAALREISDFAALGVNFRQGEFSYHRTQRELRGSIVRLGILGAATLGLFLASEGVTYYRLAAEYADVRGQSEEAFRVALPGERLIDETSQLSQALNELRDRQGQMGVPSAGGSLLEILREISARAPKNPGMIVEELSYDPGAARLSVETTSFEAVEGIKQRLAASPLFREVDVKDPRTTAEGKVSFRLTVSVGPAGSEIQP